jgi:hypothetical protein
LVYGFWCHTVQSGRQLERDLYGNFAFLGNHTSQCASSLEDVVALIDDSVTPDHLPQPLEGNALTTVSPPNQLTGNVALFLNAGAGIPHGTFSNAFNTGFGLNAGLE